MPFQIPFKCEKAERMHFILILNYQSILFLVVYLQYKLSMLVDVLAGI